MKLKFKATKQYRYHNSTDIDGVITDGWVGEVDDPLGRQLLVDYPDNFEKVIPEPVKVEPIKEKPVEEQPTKMIDEKKAEEIKAEKKAPVRRRSSKKRSK